MNKEDLIKLKEKLSKLSEEEKKERDLHLRDLSIGNIYGPQTGYPSIDKPWLKYYPEDAINSDMPNTTVYDYLYENNKDYLDNVALNYYDNKITFRELFNNIAKVENSLRNYGIKDGDIVTISLPNIPEAVYLFYAISKIGAVANMVDPRVSKKEIENYTKEVNSDVLIMIDNYYDKVEDFVDNGIVKNMIVVSAAVSLPKTLNKLYLAKDKLDVLLKKKKKVKFDDCIISWDDFINLPDKIYTSSNNDEFFENKPFVIEHTGGTTGSPKGVVLTNENINAVAKQSVMTGIKMERNETWLDVMPPFIAYGVGMGLHLPLTIGMETILIPQFTLEELPNLLNKYHPNHMVGAPCHWDSIIKNKKMKNKDLSYVMSPTVGGDTMDKNLEVNTNNFLKNHNCKYKIVKGYGMTEVCGGVSGTVPENNELGSVGIPFAKTEISTFDPETGDELEYGKIGEICISGPNTMLKYYENDEATKDVIKEHADGKKWIHSKDLGYMDNNGSLFVVDRMKRIIIRKDGFKIFPSRIEELIYTHDAIESCKVVSKVDNEDNQEKIPKAHIVLKEQYKGNEEQVEDELRELCYSNLPEYYQGLEFKFRDSLPLTSIGKIDFMKLEDDEKPFIKIKK